MINYQVSQAPGYKFLWIYSGDQLLGKLNFTVYRKNANGGVTLFFQDKAVYTSAPVNGDSAALVAALEGQNRGAA